ncbi:MAG: cyclic lactone autoinducer peptide [Bacillota bacterium]|nr:cyclic lactone autoinducer peptide [Bacillota bacterium]
MKTKLKRMYGKAVKRIAKGVVVSDVNSACPFITYQPKLPKNAKELRKF